MTVPKMYKYSHFDVESQHIIRKICLDQTKISPQVIFEGTKQEQTGIGMHQRSKLHTSGFDLTLALNI